MINWCDRGNLLYVFVSPAGYMRHMGRQQGGPGTRQSRQVRFGSVCQIDILVCLVAKQCLGPGSPHADRQSFSSVEPWAGSPLPVGRAGPLCRFAIIPLAGWIMAHGRTSGCSDDQIRSFGC